MKQAIFFSICAVLFFTAAAPQTHAYKVTSAHATPLNDTTTLFTVSFQMGFLNRETAIPIVANSAYEKDIQYAVVDKSSAVISGGTSTGMVVSTAAIKNGNYFLPKGKNGDFTLVVVYSNPNASAKSLKITELPFILYDGALTVGASIPKDSLAAFATPYTE